MITQSSPTYIVACDVGTQSTKAVLVADTGQVVATASVPHAVSFPAPGWAQQDASTWIESTTAAVRSVTPAARGPISHIAVCAQVDGVVAVDQALQPIHPALIWMDRRAQAEAASVQADLGAAEIYAITGLNSDATHGAPKMRWLLDRLGSAVHLLLPPATAVTSWLCGEVAQDHANASSSMLYDVRDRRWSSRLRDAFQIDGCLLPPVVDATTELGPVRPGVAQMLGLPAGCRVLAGTGDDHAGAVGAGALVPGVVADITGTAEPIGAASAAAVFDEHRLLELHAHAVPDLWFVENPGFISGGSVLWVARALGLGQAEVLDRAGHAPPGSRGLLFIPALSGSVTPRWNEGARGAFTGITMEHGREELCRAVIEGCAYAAKDVVDRLAQVGLPVDEVRVTGGGGRSPTWLQIKADVLGRPVRAVPGDGTVLGAACLAAAAAGWYPDVRTAADALVPPEPRWYEPDPSTHDSYESGYRRYRSVFDALEPTFEAS